MTTMSDVYYNLKVDSDGGMHCPILDTIPGLAHFQYKMEGYDNRCGRRFDILAEVYMDTIYPSEAIQAQLFTRIDKELFFGFSLDWQEGDSLYWAECQPHSKPSAKEFFKSWYPVMIRLSHVAEKKHDISYSKIWSSLSAVFCHKVYEDKKYVTYLLECGDDPHGGLGCRNKVDYLTYDKTSGKVLGVNDLITEFNADAVNDALNEAYCNEYRRKNSDQATRGVGYSYADGIAILNEGILIYYHPYMIGCGAEGQYNLVIDRHLFPML